MDSSLGNMVLVRMKRQSQGLMTEALKRHHSSYHPERNKPRQEPRGFYFVTPWSHTRFLRGPGIEARVVVLGRRSACLYPGSCRHDLMIWAARIPATHHPQTQGSRSLFVHCSFESQGQRHPFHCLGPLLWRPCFHAVESVAPQRQVPGHLQDTTRPEAAKSTASLLLGSVTRRGYFMLTHQPQRHQKP